MKSFNIQYDIGKAKYVVNFHDGIKKHNDGSEFFDIRLFKSHKRMIHFAEKLRMEGYEG